MAKYLPTTVLLLPFLSAAISCSSQNHAAQPRTAEKPVEKMTDDEYESTPAPQSVSMAMQQKLSHMQGILEGVIIQNFDQVDRNAAALKDISNTAEWMSHESVAYFNFSAKFRDQCDDLSKFARAKNLDSVMKSYTQLTQSCVDCHTFLRSERIKNDAPGRVTLADH